MREHLNNANKEILDLNGRIAEAYRQRDIAIDLVDKTKGYYCAIIDICIKRYGNLEITKDELNAEMERLSKEGAKSYQVTATDNSYKLDLD